MPLDSIFRLRFMLTLFGKPEPTLLDRLKESVSKTREQLGARLAPLLAGGREVDPDLFRELETSLLAADVGVRTTKELLAGLRDEAARGSLRDATQLKAALKDRLTEMLGSARGASAESGNNSRPQVVFVVGVNGTGKTTTIGKLAWRLRQEGRSTLVCAADTFRAAAIEQLEVWARRAGAELIRQKAGADPAAVVYDAVAAALRQSADIVIVDTAGRLHTKHNLMAELEKMKRTAAKLVPGAPHEVLLVLDATTGQNGLTQAREFTAHIGITGIVLAKLDGTAKGGIIVAISRELGLPVRFVGTGEQADDLVPFDAPTFVDSLFD
jgi:fused signal recognition particle receptor